MKILFVRTQLYFHLLKIISSNFHSFEWKGILPNHTNNTHSNLPVLVSEWYGNFHIYKRIGKNPWAWFLSSESHNLDSLLLTLKLLPYLFSKF